MVTWMGCGAVLQEHPWLHEWVAPPEPLSIDVISSLRRFHDFTTMKKIALEVRARGQTPQAQPPIPSPFEALGPFDVLLPSISDNPSCILITPTRAHVILLYLMTSKLW
jgi:hypothetical protein